MRDNVEVGETYVGGTSKLSGRNEGKKKIMVVAIQKQGNGISRMYGQVIETASRESLKRFMKDHIDANAMIKTHKWTGYKGLQGEFPNLTQEKSEKKGKNFPQLHRGIMMFKAWLKGVHHSGEHLQPYINERFNRHQMKEGIFENLISRMVRNDLTPIK